MHGEQRKAVAPDASRGIQDSRRYGRRSRRPQAELDVRKVAHDIRHELSTILLLASLIHQSEGAGLADRERADQIRREVRWLDELLTEYGISPENGRRLDAPAAVRLDTLAADIVRPFSLSSRVSITLTTQPVSAAVDRLGFWRVLRNLIGNALDAAPDDGHVAVSVRLHAGQAIVEVDDDGAGFAPKQTENSSLGLEIVADLLRQWQGRMSISSGRLGGCSVRLEFPAVVLADAAAPRQEVTVIAPGITVPRLDGEGPIEGERSA